MTGDRVFLDTNVLVYAYDITAGRKHEISRNLVTDLWKSGTGAVSTQVLQEFFVTVTRKIPKPVSLSAAREIVADLLKWSVFHISGESILDAIDLQARHRISFWDAMILSSAISLGADVVFSEDLHHGMKVAGITVQNPFL